MTSYNKLMKKIGYEFKDTELLSRALTHRSYSSGVNNERLEFLGDAVLSVVIADELFHREKDVKEGRLSRMRAALVNGEVLADLGQALGLHQFIRLGVGEVRSGGRERRSIIADALEAMIGAIYLDSSIEEARQCVLQLYRQLLIDVNALTIDKDPKSQLQEWAQSKQFPLPNYEVSVDGPAHQQVFSVTCSIEGCDLSVVGVGESRRKAEKDAAKKYMGKINDNE
jgi:ribonuclease III